MRSSLLTNASDKIVGPFAGGGLKFITLRQRVEIALEDFMQTDA